MCSRRSHFIYMKIYDMFWVEIKIIKCVCVCVCAKREEVEYEERESVKQNEQNEVNKKPVPNE